MRIHYSKVVETGANFDQNYDIKYIEASGDSSEEKPTFCIADGSVFIETDNTPVKVFIFNETSGTWKEQ